MTSRTLPTFFISHGGGPWPWIEGKMRDAHQPLASALREIPHMVGAKPKAVLMVSAHWEESEFAVMTHEHPPMFYDYNGFPDSTYHVEYPAPGAPLLAERVCGLLRDASIAVQLDPTRGIDHGCLRADGSDVPGGRCAYLAAFAQAWA